MNHIALLTDFGLKDWYVGVMKGVILSINPQARLVDITHEIQPQYVNQAGFVLWNAYSYFPEETVFISVVDPGVGSQRNILAVEAGGYYFVAPDNGLLDFVLSGFQKINAVKVENPAYFLEDISNTFHGRDIFAPVGAYLSNNIPLNALGSKISPGLQDDIFVEARQPGNYHGRVIYVDHFGNLITNIKVPENFGGSLRINDQEIKRVVQNYTQVGKGQLLLITGSSGLLEISIRDGNAAGNLGAGYNTPLWLTLD